MSVFGIILVHIFPTFSRIWTEYGEIISPYSVRRRENAGKMRIRIFPNTDTFMQCRAVTLQKRPSDGCFIRTATGEADQELREMFPLEAVVQRCSVKKMLLEISQNWQENTCVRVSFLIKLQAFFYRTPLVATFIPCWTVTTEIKELWNLKLHTLAGMLKALFILGIYFRAPRKVISFQGNHFHGYALKP